jgi:2-polyprenyl-6-methoxyphenol hydroxylase-like FAD-dependent oxidoreductase
MKATIIGAGPAGLAAAILIKKQLDADVTILEAAREEDSPGLGIALLPFAIDQLRTMELDGYAEFAARCVLIDRETRAFAERFGANDRIEQSRKQTTQYWGVKRALLLSFLTSAARAYGAKIEFGSEISESSIGRQREHVDLLVGADGAGSVVRSAHLNTFEPREVMSTSRFAWLELEGPLDKFNFGYVLVPDAGLVRITAYPHGDNECSAIVTHSAGMTGYFDRAAMVDEDGMISAAGIAAINEMFSAGLGGRRISGRSRWRTFRATHCRKAAFANVALVGDAYATVFYETGWGTSAALQEARILSQALFKRDTVAAGLDLYDRKLPEISEGLVAATTKTMLDVDGQEARFAALGPAGFLASFPA